MGNKGGVVGIKVCNNCTHQGRGRVGQLRLIKAFSVKVEINQIN